MYIPKLYPRELSTLQVIVVRLIALVVGMYAGVIVVTECFLLFAREKTLIFYVVH